MLVGVQGSAWWCCSPVRRPADSELPDGPAARIAEAFGRGPVVAGPTVPSLAEAHRSATDALSGLRAVVGWPAAPRPVPSADLLPERALAGDPEAVGSWSTR